MPACNVPVALFVFNRPDLTRRVFARVAQARPPTLLLVADGPRRGHRDDAHLCQEAREVLRRVDWPCRVLSNLADENLGCRQRVSSGLDWVFSQVDCAVLLEDDCLPEPTFFTFCAELLARYRGDERIHMIRGSNFLRGQRLDSSSYYFSRFFHIWGWATWARAWQHYDVTMARWPGLRDTAWLGDRLPPHMVPLVRQIFDETHDGRLPTWEFQWEFASWLRNAVAISPWQNLITNIGFDASGTHMKDQAHPYADLPTAPMRFPLRHPGRVAIHARADLQEWDLAFPQAARARTPWRRLQARFDRLRSSLYRFR